MFNISSSYNRKKPINNIYSLNFSAFIHIRSHFSFSAHHCSGATHCSPNIAVSSWTGLQDTPSVTSGVTGRSSCSKWWDEQRQQWGWAELCRSDSPPCKGDRLSSRYQGGSRCHHLCPPWTGQQLPPGMSPAGRQRGSFRPLLPLGAVSKETSTSHLSLTLGLQGRCKPSQGHTARCHLGVTRAPSGTALHLLPTSEPALLSNPG